MNQRLYSCSNVLGFFCCKTTLPFQKKPAYRYSYHLEPKQAAFEPENFRSVIFKSPLGPPPLLRLKADWWLLGGLG